MYYLCFYGWLNEHRPFFNIKIVINSRYEGIKVDTGSFHKNEQHITVVVFPEELLVTSTLTRTNRL